MTDPTSTDTPPTPPTPPATRSVDLTVEIAATPDDIWTAITDPEELIRWFPPTASGEPKDGGHIVVSWGAGSEWKSNIVVWQPGVHLRLEDELPAEVKEQGVVMALDYFIDAKDGGTVLRLVNSGFSADDEWDDYFHMVENGWTFFLWNLKHYLERHPGTPRTLVSVRPQVSGTREEVWAALFDADGLGDVGPAGEPFQFNLGSETLSGEAVLSDPPWSFAGMVDSLNDGVLHVEMEGTGESWKVGVWLSGYGVDEARCLALQQALETRLGALLPASSA